MATKISIKESAHKHGVRISEDAIEVYSHMKQEDVEGMISHAAQLTKAFGKSTISVELARVEMRHYSKK